MKAGARDLVHAWVPLPLIERYRAARLVRRARMLSRLAARAPSIDACCRVIEEFPEFRPLQKRAELVAFLDRVASLHPKVVCEIGAASGGTLCALAHTARPSTIISVDIDFTRPRLGALPVLGRADQTIACIAGDSHTDGVRARVAGIVGGRSLDLLFIDGDHSYGGVRGDFEAYCQLVRAGGLIAFHDIMLDYRTRFGTQTPSDSGGVPTFWNELKERYPDHEEIVASPEQDGYGIGLLRWPA